MKTISTISVKDGHDYSGKREIEVLLVCFMKPEGYEASRYFGLPAGIPKAALEGRPCCINVVESTSGGLRLTPISGAGPDVNMYGNGKIVLDP